MGKRQRRRSAASATKHAKKPRIAARLERIWNVPESKETVEVDVILKQLALPAVRAVLVQGIAGTGKSHTISTLVKHLEDHAPEMNVVVACPTGVAAMNLVAKDIPAVTIHSALWLGINNDPSVKPKGYCYQRAARIQLLIIDEIGMVDANLFTRVLQVLPEHVKLVLVGDFMQIPPIDRSGYAFCSPVWPKGNALARVRLRHNYRARDDPEFQGMLCRVRRGDFTVGKLFDECVRPAPTNVTRLMSYKRDVEAYNERMLGALPGPVQLLPARVSVRSRLGGDVRGFRFREEDLTPEQKRELAKDLKEAQRICGDRQRLNKASPVDLNLRLKHNAVVMVRKNHCVQGACNGTVDIVEFDAATETWYFGSEGSPVTPQDFVIPVGKMAEIVIKQLPLSLSWATSIHKAQGLTMNNACVDPRTFSPGMLYVALSRVNGLSGLYLRQKLPSSWRTHGEAVREWERDEALGLLARRLASTGGMCDVRNMLMRIKSFL